MDFRLPGFNRSGIQVGDPVPDHRPPANSPSTPVQPHRTGSLTAAPRNASLMKLPAAGTAPPMLAGSIGTPVDASSLARQALGMDPQMLRRGHVEESACVEDVNQALVNIATMKVEIAQMLGDLDVASHRKLGEFRSRQDPAGQQRVSQATQTLRDELMNSMTFLKDREQEVLSRTGPMTAPPKPAPAQTQTPAKQEPTQAAASNWWSSIRMPWQTVIPEDASLSALARKEAQKAPAPDKFFTDLLPDSDKELWRKLEQRDIAGARCLSRLVERANDDPKYLNAERNDPGVYEVMNGHMAKNLMIMQREFAAGRMGFVDHMLSLARENVGTNDKVIFGNLVPQYNAKKLGFEVTHDVLIPQLTTGDGRPEAGICLRAATKWAACQVVGAPFKYEGMNVGKMVDKQDAYVKSPSAGGDTPVERIANRGAVSVNQWIEEFTTTGEGGVKQKHPDKIEKTTPLLQDPASLLADKTLADGQAMVIGVTWTRPDGTRGAHAIAVSGGKEPKLFDSGQRTEYKFTGEDLGSAINRYVETTWGTPHGNTNLQYLAMPLNARTEG